MITVMTVFYHPDLGTVRGIVIKGKPMLSCHDLAALLVGPHVEETEKVMRRLYGAMDITVPAVASRDAGAVTEKLLFVDEDAVFRMIECTSNRAWERYVAWFNDYVFPSLCQLGGTHYIGRDVHRFYDTCADPVPSKPVSPDSEEFFRMFE